MPRHTAYDPPMARLERYILRQCFGVMIFVTAALSAAIWLAQSLRLIDLIVNRGLSIEVFLYLAALILPRFLDIVLPIGAFIAVLFTFNRLITESELVVMRSAGLSHLSLARPVMMLAGIAFVILMSLSVYFLPASNRAFKDLQFEIRNRLVSSLVQEGTFTTISDKITIYVRSRNDRGEVTGLLIHDSRNPQRQVTIVAERGAFVDSPTGSRIVMRNGNRQQFDTETHKLSLLSFDSYTLDLGTLHDAPVVRFREAQERFLDELFFPPPDAKGSLRLGFLVEGHQRILVPLSAFSLALIPLACLLPGELNRRGQLKRVLFAIALAFLFELVDLGVSDIATRSAAAIPLMYVATLLPLCLGFAILMQRGIKTGLRRPTLAIRPAH
ncbi:MAG: LPS export ABC transporter permease LptF [Alphaproteobacteria bacterium]|nr:LPS export ABC transporter permease LptF [Alphaproteobacteria bacterium]